MTPDISISIINTNNKEQTLGCLRSVYTQSGSVKLEVFVVDNDCTDGSKEAIQDQFPQVNLIINQEMLGFSTNNNLVLSRAAGRYLMLLNDDTIVQEHAIASMLAFMDSHFDAGAVGACLLNPDGTYQNSWDFLPNPIDDGFRPFSTWLRRHQLNKPTRVGSVSGACLMVRREVVELVGLLDTDFDPLYSEEVDWCYRIRKAGWEVYHLPQAKVIHFGSQTMDRMPLYKLERLYEKKALYYKKHHGFITVWVFKISLLSSSIIKLFLWALFLPLSREKSTNKIRSHFHIIKKSIRL